MNKHKGTRMEKINVENTWQTWKIEAKLFKNANHDIAPLSYVKHKQFDFSLLAMEIYRKKSISFNTTRSISDSYVSILNPKWRGCVFFIFFFL